MSVAKPILDYPLADYPHLIQHVDMPGVRFKSVLPHPVDNTTLFLEHYEGIYTLAPVSKLVWLGNKYVAPKPSRLCLGKALSVTATKDLDKGAIRVELELEGGGGCWAYPTNFSDGAYTPGFFKGIDPHQIQVVLEK